MNGNQGALRAAALAAALDRSRSIDVRDGDLLFADPMRNWGPIDGIPRDPDSLRRTLDRARRDLESIGITTSIHNGQISRTIDTVPATARTVTLDHDERELLTNLRRALRLLDPENVRTIDPASLVKAHIDHVVELEYNDGSIITGSPVQLSMTGRPTVTVACSDRDERLYVDAIRSLRVVADRGERPPPRRRTVKPRPANPTYALRPRRGRGRPSDPAVLALARRVIDILESSDPRTAIPYDELALQTGATRERLISLRRVIEALDDRVDHDREGYVLHPRPERDSAISGGVALSARIHCRAFEALGANGRATLWSKLNQPEEWTPEFPEDELADLAYRLDGFLTRLAPTEPAVISPFVATVLDRFDPSVEHPWVHAGVMSISIEGRATPFEVQPCGLIWTNDAWFLRTGSRSAHHGNAIPLASITGCL